VLYLLSILAYLAYDEGECGAGTPCPLAGVLLALLSKTSVVVLPLVLLLCVWWNGTGSAGRR